MALTPSWPGPTGLATTTDGRKALAGLIVKNTAGVARHGVFPAHTNALVTARSDLNVDIGAFQATAVQFGGPILLTNDGTAQLPAPLVSPVSGTNFYVIYAKQNESAAPGTDTGTTTVFGAALSTTSFAAARANPAQFPTGALELATVQMPTGMAATNAVGVTITQTHQYTAAAGGTVWVRNSTEREAWTPADGNTAHQMDTGASYRRQGGAWRLDPRIASGLVTPPSGAFVTVNLPAGLFPSAPIILATIRSGDGGAGGATARITGVSASSFQIGVSATGIGFAWGWTATETV